MAITRGQYGMGSRVTDEYFAVEIRYADGCAGSDLVAAPTFKIALAKMYREYRGKFGDEVKWIILRPIEKKRFMDEMADFAYWAKHAGGHRGPEPVL